MIILGVILLIIGFVAGISILWTIGIVVVIIGAILDAAGPAEGCPRITIAPADLGRTAEPLAAGSLFARGEMARTL